jgi:hypothetical protein
MNGAVTSKVQIVGTDNSGIFQTVDVQTVDKTLFGYNGEVTGLNMYQIIPKVKQLVMSGKCDIITNRIYGGDITTLSISSNIWGALSAYKTFYAYSDAGPVTIYYDYVDQDANEKSGQIDVSFRTWKQFTEINIAGINKVRTSRRLTTSDQISITVGVTGRAYAIFFSSPGSIYNSYLNSVITCPNNAIMYVTNISTLSSTQSEIDLCIMRYQGNTGVTDTIFATALSGWTNHIAAGSDGTLGGYMYPGDAILMYTTYNSSGTTNWAYANVVIKYLS